jgi:hypothetical protein
MANRKIVESDKAELLQKLTPELLHRVLYDVKPLPPTQPVIIRVERAPNKPPQLSVKQPAVLKENEQLAWTSPDARIEIRFSPALSPFNGAAFETPRGGKVYSGLPNGKFGARQNVKYKVLATTPDGILLDQTIEFVVLHPPAPDKPKSTAAKAKGSRGK